MIYDGGTIRGARVLEKADLLINENTTILFDPATGAIKNWSKIK